jgi:hypothetical protein
MKEPYYTIEFSALNCKFEILINDIPIISMISDGQMSPNLPINYGIYNSGKQVLTIKLSSLTGEKLSNKKTNFSFKVKLYDVFNEFNFIKDCIENEIIINDQYKLSSIINHFDFEAEISFQLIPFNNSVDLAILAEKDKSIIQNKLTNAYNKILNILHKEQFDLFRELMSNRESNMAKSMYLEEVDANARINSLIYDLKNGFKPLVLPLNRMIHIYGYGKLACFRNIDGDPALILFNEKTNEEVFLDLMFRIPLGKEEFEVI